MTRIEATAVVPAPREKVFAFLSDLGNHWAVAGRWIEVVAVDGDGDGGRVRIRGPLGLHRTAITSVERIDPPERLQGIARVGGARAEVTWMLRERDAGATEVVLGATVLRAGALDRLVLGLGGAAWMRRLFAATLAHLANRYEVTAARA